MILIWGEGRVSQHGCDGGLVCADWMWEDDRSYRPPQRHRLLSSVCCGVNVVLRACGVYVCIFQTECCKKDEKAPENQQPTFWNVMFMASRSDKLSKFGFGYPRCRVVYF